ncbi:MAG TPA: DUF4142 domain-containing protein [Chitinophagaceae bacterium]|nr:DUF4142 domain-containing protein [Chitinophagaceae bacterium]
MKLLKKWAVSLMLLPAIYLASCGSGKNEKDKQDDITTQSPPPTLVNPSSGDVHTPNDTSSSMSGGRSEPTASATTSSTTAERSTGKKSGSTGLSHTDRTAITASGESKNRVTKKTKTPLYEQNKGTTHHSSLSKEKSSKTDDQLAQAKDKSSKTEIERITDTAASKLRELGDTTAKKIQAITDTAAKKMDRLADSTATDLSKLGDSSTMPMHHMMMGDSTGKTPAHWMTDSSGKKSTMDTGINFNSSVFIPDQIRSNYAEIKMARMAIDKSQNDAVKQVATTLENDHNSLLRELQAMAKNPVNGADSIPTSENDMAKQHMDMMKNMTGQEFDRQWLQHMHMMHDQKIRMFEQAETNNSIQDAELRIWVEKTLPTLRKHRDMLAQTLNAINK